MINYFSIESLAPLSMIMLHADSWIPLSLIAADSLLALCVQLVQFGVYWESMNGKKYEFASCCSIEFFGMFEKRFKYTANTEHNFMLLNKSEWGLWIIWWLSNVKHKSPSSGRLAKKLSVRLLHSFYYFSFDFAETTHVSNWWVGKVKVYIEKGLIADSSSAGKIGIFMTP